jgi:CRISPR-associated protein Cas1
MLYAQFELGKPLQKNLWQTVVKRKIKNQSLCLKFLNKPGWQELDEMANSVKSGDTENVEAVAAAYYFPKLFGAGFVREDDRIENSAMNYGYAVIRGGIARNLVMHGLEPCIGIHHHSELNNFNLADDMIEPYRPLVDLMVATEHFDSDLDSDLTPELKKKLFNVTNYLLFQKGKRVRAMTSIDRSTASLAKSVTESETLLELPELIPLEEGRYE